MKGAESPGAVPLAGALLAAALLPAPLAAQEWLGQTYQVSARLEAEAETLTFPPRRDQLLIVPESFRLPRVCVDASASIRVERGRTEVTVLITRQAEDDSESLVQRLRFAWREGDPYPVEGRCQAAPPLLAGDVVEFRFRFFDMPPLALVRRGQRIQTLPVLTVTGWLERDPLRE